MISGEDFDRLSLWADVMNDSNYYELLGVLELADAEAIRIAFHEFSLAFHPDVHLDATEEERDLARRVFQRGAEAYRVLSNPDLRTRYDLTVAQGKLRFEGTTGPPRGRVRVKTLEDVCRSPAAKLCARKADEEISRGRLVEARRLLQEAEAHDGFDNDELDQRIEDLDVALFAQGT